MLGDDSTRIVTTGDDVDMGNDQKVKVTEVTAKSVGLLIDGKKKELKLGSSKELISKASAATAKSEKNDKKSGTTILENSSFLDILIIFIVFLACFCRGKSEYQAMSGPAHHE